VGIRRSIPREGSNKEVNQKQVTVFWLNRILGLQGKQLGHDTTRRRKRGDKSTGKKLSSTKRMWVSLGGGAEFGWLETRNKIES